MDWLSRTDAGATRNRRDDDGGEIARGICFVRLKALSEMTKTKAIPAR
jgi:hypothetical protein